MPTNPEGQNYGPVDRVHFSKMERTAINQARKHIVQDRKSQRRRDFRARQKEQQKPETSALNLVDSINIVTFPTQFSEEPQIFDETIAVVIEEAKVLSTEPVDIFIASTATYSFDGRKKPHQPKDRSVREGDPLRVNVAYLEGQLSALNKSFRSHEIGKDPFDAQRTELITQLNTIKQKRGQQPRGMKKN